jgi:hypothetical protein
MAKVHHHLPMAKEVEQPHQQLVVLVEEATTLVVVVVEEANLLHSLQYSLAAGASSPKAVLLPWFFPLATFD